MNLPNKITVFRFACIPFLLAASLIQFPYHWSVALVIYFIACMSDKADGIIARKQGLVTDFGKLMDPLSDKSLVLAAYLVFVNALEASKTDTVNLSVTEVIEDGQAIFTVTDDGPGILGSRYSDGCRCGGRGDRCQSVWQGKDLLANVHYRSDLSAACHR